VSALAAQTRAELALTMRNGEQILLTLAIPVLVLTFFSLVEVLPLPDGVDDPVDFLAPGVLALAIVSTAFTSLAISTGFDRQYGVLKRLGATPLGRPRLLAAKTLTVLAVMVVQFAVLGAVAVALGWRPEIAPLPLVGGAILATVAFAGLALLMAGTLPGLITLAAANGVYVVLLLLGDLVIPHESMPDALAAVASLLPTAALADLLRAGFSGEHGPGQAWVVLAVWAVLTPLAAARWFRWE
jgi:ABC-2 type transport system permease protein